ncbi:bifunctional diguanylate cyclase/phosphodiesterase [Haliea sp.]
MSLFKQLWLAIILLLTLVFGSTFVVSSLSAKRYLEQQLYMKNVDNAAALALSLTQQEADPVLLELTLAAQFDTGHYELIELVDPDGNPVIRREDTRQVSDAPAWFVRLLPIEVEPGHAQVQQGWQQVGTLTLRSHSRFAYRELWDSAQLLALVFLVTLLIGGILGSYLLRVILRPLNAVVEQAEAIGQRRFVTIPEPRTLEFRRLVSAMNALSQRIKTVLQREGAQLEQMQRASHRDAVTGLTNREPFMHTLVATLESDDVNATGTVVLIRIGGLGPLNQRYGHDVVDGLLRDAGKALDALARQHSRWSASRLNGSDFALLAPRNLEPEQLARQVRAAFREVIASRNMLEDCTLPCAATVYNHGDTQATLLTRLDGALLAANSSESTGVSITRAGDIRAMPVRDQMDHWQTVLDRAFAEQGFSLATYPVQDMDKRLLHLEAPVRLQQADKQLPAGVFLPWINRLELSSELDKYVVDLALRIAAVQQQPLAINLSVGALVEPSFPLWLSDRLATAGTAAGNLWLELPESMAFRHLQAFKRLAASARRFGCKVGIEHVGHQLADIGQLHDVGLDYLKVDAAFVRDVDTNAGNQALLRTLCTVGHAIGVIVIAEGVRTAAEQQQLAQLGFDGVTGPGVRDDEQ